MIIEGLELQKGKKSIGMSKNKDKYNKLPTSHELVKACLIGEAKIITPLCGIQCIIVKKQLYFKEGKIKKLK